MTHTFENEDYFDPPPTAIPADLFSHIEPLQISNQSSGIDLTQFSPVESLQCAFRSQIFAAQWPIETIPFFRPGDYLIPHTVNDLYPGSELHMTWPPTSQPSYMLLTENHENLTTVASEFRTPTLLSHGPLHSTEAPTLSEPLDLFESPDKRQFYQPKAEEIILQSPRFKGDLYKPRWVRGKGNEREGWCELCKRWLNMKNSSFWLDKVFSHGICARTGYLFDEPLETRAIKDKLNQSEGFCGTCKQWIKTVGQTGRAWFRHASKVSRLLETTLQMTNVM